MPIIEAPARGGLQQVDRSGASNQPAPPKPWFERFHNALFPGGRLLELDGVRGIAVVMVMLYHFWQFSGSPRFPVNLLGGFDLAFLPAGGFAGVALFFVLSGFMLFLPWAKGRTEQKPMPSAGRYFLRRIQRIVPAYYLNLFVILLVIGPAAIYISKIPIGWDLLAHLLFIQNVSPLTHQSINGVAWTLGVEAQLYLMLPLLAPLALRWGPVRTAAAGVLVAVVWRGLAVGLLSTGNHDHLWIWATQTPGNVDQFALGMAAAMLWADHSRKPGSALQRAWLGGLLAPVGALTVLAALARSHGCDCLYRHGAPDLWWWNSLVGLGFTAIVLGSLAALRPIRWLLAARPLRLIGVAGYGVYLWHFQIADLLIRHGLFGGASSGTDKLLRLAIAAGPLALLVGTLSWLLIERPCLNGSFSFPSIFRSAPHRAAGRERAVADRLSG